MGASAAPSGAIVLFGTEEPRPEVTTLAAGRLSAELEAGKLRYVKVDGLEAIRAIAFVVRGPGWETFHPKISNLNIGQDAEGFTVTYDGEIDVFCGHLRLSASIEGKSDGSLRFDVTCDVLREFDTGRTGFVILHRAGVAGEPCQVEHVDGTVEDTEFPDRVMALQPFFDIRSIRHHVAPGVSVTCAMEGAHAWECEDQRNWTDASYKTYYRPLSLPFPYKLPAGETVRQNVTLKVDGARAGAVTGAGGEVAVTLGGPTGQNMPAIGFGVPVHQAEASLAVADLVRAIGPRILVCGIDPNEGHGKKELEAYKRLSEATGVPVQLEIVVPCERAVTEEIAAVAADVRAVGLVPEAVVVEQARLLKFTLETIEALGIPTHEETYAAARAAFPGVTLGGGVFSSFTELNRNQPAPALYDFITHSTCAVVHEVDDRSVMETLETLPYIIRSVRAFSDNKPYRIAPSVIGMRQNPYGPSTYDNQDNVRMSFNQQEPRHRALFGSSFTLGYVARMAAGGVDIVSIGAPIGEFGMAYRKMDHPQLWFDDLSGGAVFPLCHIVAAMSGAAGTRVMSAESAVPGKVLALSYAQGAGRLVWLANLTPESQRVRLENPPASTARIGGLDADNFVQATTEPEAFAADEGTNSDPAALELKPYGVARLVFDR